VNDQFYGKRNYLTTNNDVIHGPEVSVLNTDSQTSETFISISQGMLRIEGRSFSISFLVCNRIMIYRVSFDDLQGSFTNLLRKNR